jgi:hypothetical protein
MHASHLSKDPTSSALRSGAKAHRRASRLVGSLALLTGLVAPVVILGASSPAGAIPPPPSCGAPVASGSNDVVTCSYTGADQSWTVPAGVTEATFDAYGAEGGSPFAPAGDGGQATGAFAVTPTVTFTIAVGGAGGSCAGSTAFGGGGDGGGGGAGICGGGGGGASSIDTGATPLVVAGGGGGGANCESTTAASGGGGGGASGDAGDLCIDNSSGIGEGGAPGTSSAGGTGTGGSGNGSAGQGGSGTTGTGLFGNSGGGGGGGGYYGGAGGEQGAGGGGGSGFVDPSAISSSMTSGVQAGNGVVTITYATPTACGAPVASGSNEVVTCSYTGGGQIWTVPTGVTQATFDVYGAQGGNSDGGGGDGGQATAVFAVAAADTYTVVVGGAGSPSTCPSALGGFGGGGDGGTGPNGSCPGGGGGGASSVDDGPMQLVVAGGGGGGGNCFSVTAASGGSGGGTSGGAADVCIDDSSGVGEGGAPGTSSGGGVGTGGAGSGSAGQGGAGADAESPGGGGGGGYYGGAGGQDAAGGGGGSGFVDPSALSSSMNTGVQSGSGVITITYANPVSTTNLVSTPDPTSVTLGTTSPTLTDSAVLSGGNSPTGTITFTLYDGSTLVNTESATVSGNGTYSTPTGYLLPSTGTVTGTYQWDAYYSGDSSNTHSWDYSTDEQVVVSSASPSLSTTPNETSTTFGAATTLTDSATLSGAYFPTNPDTITFTLTSPTSAVVDTEVVSVAGDGTYSTPTGYTLPTANTGTVAGTYQWDASFSGDGNNSSVSDNGAANEQVVVSPAATTTTYTGIDEVGINSSLVPTATLTSAAASCQSGQPVTFSLNADPFNGTVESYTLETQNSASNGSVNGATVSTKGWEDGVYTITASYSGTPNCEASGNTEVLSVTAPGLFAFGGGSYPVSNLGPTSFGFGVVRTMRGRTPSYSGQLYVATNGKWLFQATVTSFGVTSPTQALLSGTGSLYLWSSSLNRGRGGWSLVKSKVAYNATANATTRSSPGSFGITIDYTPTGTQPALPGYAPIALSHGGIVT